MRESPDRWKALPPRFWAKVRIGDFCWTWQSSKGRGYGLFWINGRYRPAHRIAFERLVGPVPDGLALDHLCRNRACVNPDHLEPVTMQENLLRGDTLAAANARKTHCKRGHPCDAPNTYMDGGSRICRTCKRANELRRRARARA